MDGHFCTDLGTKKRQLIEMYESAYQSMDEAYYQTEIVFDTDSPYEILSEQFGAKHLDKLYQCIKGHLTGTDEYDGIIITTGTDTLAYTTAAVGLLFQNTPIPIVMVSANHPLDDETGNGFVNFAGAVTLILENYMSGAIAKKVYQDIDFADVMDDLSDSLSDMIRHKGVYISYDNQNAHYIHEAGKILCQFNYEDDVFSCCNDYYGTVIYEDGYRRIELREDGRMKKPLDTTVDFLGTDQKLDLTYERAVAFLRPYPGMSYPLLTASDTIKAVILDTYHSGTFPTEDEAFLSFAKEARAQEIPVFVAGVPMGYTYESTKAYEQEGIHVCKVASPVAMYIKLWIGVMMHVEDLIGYMMS